MLADFLQEEGLKNVELVEGSTARTSFFTYGDYFYCFYIHESGNPYFLITRTNGSTYNMPIADDAFENGKYYFFADEDEPSTYNLGKMTAGN